MKIKTAFKTLRRDFKEIKTKDFQEKTIYLMKLLEKIKIEHMRLEPFYLYDLVKKKYEKFERGLKFECLQCRKSCCFFTKEEFSSSILGLFEEDIKKIQKVDPKLEGVKMIPNSIIIEEFEDIFRGFKEVFKIKSYKSFYKKIVKTLGFKSNLRIIKEGEKYKCYYFDERRGKCKIHSHKPITCFSYPYRINNGFSEVGIKYCKECHFNQKSYNKLDLFQLNWFFSKKHSYWEYLFAVYLYLRTKRNMVMNSSKGIIKPEFFKELLC